MSNAAPPPPPPNPYQTIQPLNPADEKLWATLIHLGGIVFGFIPALVGYLVLRDRGPFIRHHAATALNFQISIMIYSIGLVIITVLTLGIGGLLFLPFGVAVLVFMIIAAVKANQGQFYTYPLTIRFVN